MAQYPPFSLKLLSFLYLMVPIHATYTSNTTRRGIRWLEPKRSALVRISTPDLPLWNPAEHIGENIPSNFILTITLSADNRTLLVQDQPFLPLPNPDRPARLYAPQTSLSPEEFHAETLPDLRNPAHFALDYARLVRPRDDWSVSYEQYDPEISLDLLGAGIENHNALLPSRSQWIIQVRLEGHGIGDRRPEVRNKVPDRTFSISDIWLQSRDEQYEFPNMEGPRECTLRSWRCGDVGAAPWYIFVFRRDFDEWGRIGSLRHEVMKRWDTLCGNFRPLLLIAVLSIAFGGLGYAIYLLMAQRRERLGQGGEEGYEYVVVEGGEVEADSDGDGEWDEKDVSEKQDDAQDEAQDGEAASIRSTPSRSGYHR